MASLYSNAILTSEVVEMSMVFELPEFFKMDEQLTAQMRQVAETTPINYTLYQELREKRNYLRDWRHA